MASSPSMIRLAIRRSTIQGPARVSRAHSIRSQSSNAGSSGGGAHVLSGLAGGALALGAAYGVYSFSSAGRLHGRLNQTVSQADKYYNEATKKFQESTPDANEAIDYLKKTAYTYAAFIPGGRGYVDTAFKDLDSVREKHGDKVDEILKDTYSELQKISKSGMSMESVQSALSALEKMGERLASEAGDAFENIVNNHPALKDKLGGRIDQLKQMADQYGPQAKEQADQVWNEVQDVLKGGLSAANIDKIRKIIEEKVQQLQKLGDEAWKEGLEKAKPFLDKNPKAKQLLEENADKLKKGNVKELFSKVQENMKSGNVEDLEGYVKEAVNKATK